MSVFISLSSTICLSAWRGGHTDRQIGRARLSISNMTFVTGDDDGDDNDDVLLTPRRERGSIDVMGAQKTDSTALHHINTSTQMTSSRHITSHGMAHLGLVVVVHFILVRHGRDRPNLRAEAPLHRNKFRAASHHVTSHDNIRVDDR